MQQHSTSHIIDKTQSDDEPSGAITVSVNGSTGTGTADYDDEDMESKNDINTGRIESSMDEEDVDAGRRTRRLAMNRITARERRRRKRQHLENLEGEVEKLTIMNENLQRMNGNLRVQINSVISAISLSGASPALQVVPPIPQAQGSISSSTSANPNPLLNQALLNQQSLELLSSLQRLQQLQQEQEQVAAVAAAAAVATNNSNQTNSTTASSANLLLAALRGQASGSPQSFQFLGTNGAAGLLRTLAAAQGNQNITAVGSQLQTQRSSNSSAQEGNTSSRLPLLPPMSNNSSSNTSNKQESV